MFQWFERALCWLDKVAQWLKRVVTQPLGELNRWQMAVRFAYDLGRFGARQLRHDRAEQMASALAFRTLFGLLPVLVVATVLVKAMGMADHFMEPMDELFRFLGVDDVQIVPPTDVNGGTTTLGVWLRDRVREAEQVNLAAIGWVGLGVTLYAAISLMATIEDCFNIIYRAPQGRSWALRVPIYWFVLTISPVVLVFSTYVDGYFKTVMTGWETEAWVGTTVSVLWSMLAIWLLMFAVYSLFPNTHVRKRAAAVGAVFAAVLLEIGKRTMGIYLENALSISQLYGSLGLIPLFMFWVYLMWLAVLFGLQVSSTLQHLHGRQIAELKARRMESTLVDPGKLVVLMEYIAQQFRDGKSSRLSDIATVAALPEPVVETMVGGLESAGFLHRLADDESCYVMSQPLSDVSIKRLLEIAFEAADREEPISGEGEAVLRRLRQAQVDAVAGQDLTTLLADVSRSDT